MANIQTKVRLRTTIITIILIIAFIFGSVRTLQYQVVEGADYLLQAQERITSQQTIKAARGEIVDCYGNPLVINKVGFNIVFDRAFFPVGTENETIVKLFKILEETEEPWIDNLPISISSSPFDFHEDRKDDVAQMIERLRLNNYATAQNCMEEMMDKFDVLKITSDLSLIRKIIAVRYEMLARKFSIYNNYTFAENISGETVAKIKELSYELPGVDIAETTNREYVSGTTAPHIIGTIGPIYAEEMQNLKGQGYEMDDYVGKSGIESSLEEYLRGTNGKREVVQDSKGNVLEVNEIKSPSPGNTVMLTIDTVFQDKLQDVLKNHIAWVKKAPKGYNVKGGAIAVIKVKTGEVIGLANYPSYDINDFKIRYSELIKEKNKPTLDRCLRGLYRPGSTFKTVVAVGGLTENVINKHSTVHCAHVYTRFGTSKVNTFTCLGYHGTISLVSALKVSCNIFFYDVGWRLGIDNIKKYGNALGLGVQTGLEITHASGHISGPEYKPSADPWVPGDVVQSSIGQSENYVTPLSMAIQAATIANKGVRMEAHIIKSIQKNDFTQTVKTIEPVVANRIDAPAAVFEAVTEGMIAASQNIGGEHSLSNLGFKVAYKTGSPQEGKKVNSAVIAFWPADDPEIAMSCILEEGVNANYSVRKVIQAYIASQNRSHSKPQLPGELLQ